MRKRQRSDRAFDLFNVRPTKRQRKNEAVEQKEREESESDIVRSHEEELQVKLTHGLNLKQDF